MRADVLAVGRDQHDRRPRLHAVRSPCAELAVVHHRVPYPKAAAGRADVVGLPLGDELARVYADYDKLALVLLLEPVDHRQHVHAVDSAIRPEVEQQELTAQVFQA